MEKRYSRNSHYKLTSELNPQDSPSTGTLTCYDGDIEYSDDGVQPCIFIEIADCHQKIRLHMSHTDSIVDFLKKIEKMINALKKFEHHLIYVSPHSPNKK